MKAEAAVSAERVRAEAAASAERVKAGAAAFAGSDKAGLAVSAGSDAAAMGAGREKQLDRYMKCKSSCMIGLLREIFRGIFLYISGTSEDI